MPRAAFHWRGTNFAHRLCEHTRPRGHHTEILRQLIRAPAISPAVRYRRLSGFQLGKAGLQRSRNAIPRSELNIWLVRIRTPFDGRAAKYSNRPRIRFDQYKTGGPRSRMLGGGWGLSRNFRRVSIIRFSLSAVGSVPMLSTAGQAASVLPCRAGGAVTIRDWRCRPAPGSPVCALTTRPKSSAVSSRNLSRLFNRRRGVKDRADLLPVSRGLRPATRRERNGSTRLATAVCGVRSVAVGSRLPGRPVR